MISNASYLELENGDIFRGLSFGHKSSISGEVIFNTGMVGYPESLTDPSYFGQIIVFTYPLIGNYGVPSSDLVDGIERFFESDRIQAAGVIVSESSINHSHWSSVYSFNDWLTSHQIPALMGIDTRQLTKTIRQHGSMLGRIVVNSIVAPYFDPNSMNLLPKVSVPEPVAFPAGPKMVVLIDCGCKHSIIRSLIRRDISVTKVPWNFDFSDLKFDGIVLSNGPGDPQQYIQVTHSIQKYLAADKPILGICLGNQILALSSGATTYKMRFGHRSQNQPCIAVDTQRCYITSQNHGFAIEEHSLTEDWLPWFINANDGTIEGIRHRIKPFFGVQFHPEASPGPLDTKFIFDMFAGLL